MILLDYNQTIIANLMAQLGNHTNAPIDENAFRHMAINSIRNIHSKFSATYGELVIACDGPNSWRRGAYIYYKANRRKKAEASEIDWTMIHGYLDLLRQELIDYFPYRVIRETGAEADDVIATLVMEFADSQKMMIVSADHDFRQLHRYPLVSQYDAIGQRPVLEKEPERYLAEHILRGDPGDGVPNVLSPDDVFVDEKKRQSPLTKKRLTLYLANFENMDEETQRRFNRNRLLIDLAMVPKDIRRKVMHSYHSQKPGNRSRIMTYMIKHGMKHMLADIGDF